MEFNSFLFPAPPSSYTIHGGAGDLLYIPRMIKIDNENQNQAGQDQDIQPFSENAQKENQDEVQGDSRTTQIDKQKVSISDRQVFENRRKIHSFMLEENKILDQDGIEQFLEDKDTKIIENDQLKLTTHIKKSRSNKTIQEIDIASLNISISQYKLSNSGVIPCVFLPFQSGSSKILVYFHGNAEDIGLATELLDYIRTLMRVNKEYYQSYFHQQVHVLAMEYPGYGIYDGQPEAQRIQEDAVSVYTYLVNIQKIPESSIIIFGRSIGTGPATYIGSQFNPCSLLLMSPFKSIRDIVKGQAGKYASYLINDRFRNIDLIDKVTCPTFIVHGQRDTLIPCAHSHELYQKCGGPSALKIPPDMDHNEFDFNEDLIKPFAVFLRQCKINVDIDDLDLDFDDADQDIDWEVLLEIRRQRGQIKFPEDLYLPPKDFPKTNSNSNLWNWILRKFM